MSYSIPIDATELPINSVCVFRANKAEVHRVIPVDLQAGQNEIVIEKLPNGIDEDSIRVEGLGNAVIFDVIYSPPPPPQQIIIHQGTKSDSGSSPEIKALAKRISQLRAERTVLKDQTRVLDDYSKSVKAETADAKTLGTFLQLYMEKKRALKLEMVEVTEMIDVAEKEVQELNKVSFQDDEGRKRAVKVTVIVHAKEKGNAELSLRYMVSGASWQPLYDLRAKISTTAKETSTISLQYRASIAQQTGEDWTDVDLTLSTASPQHGAQVPTLPPFRIGRPLPPPQPVVYQMSYRKQRTSAPNIVRITSQSSMSSEEEEVFVARSVQAPPPPLAIRVAEAVEGATSSTFTVGGKTTIPSDGDDGSSTHKVSIAVIELVADLEWVSVPRLHAAAFLRCKVKNASSYTLLEGPCSVYIDGSFVCKNTLSNVSPQEIFSTSLGIDPAVRITYHNQQKKTNTWSGGIMGAKNDVTAFTQRISVKNTRGTPIAPLYVKDHVPVSEDNDIKVVVNEPKALESPTSRKEVSVVPGIKARWGYKETVGDGGVEDEGVVEFICDVAAGKTVELALAWDVLAPAGRHWVKR